MPLASAAPKTEEDKSGPAPPQTPTSTQIPRLPPPYMPKMEGITPPMALDESDCLKKLTTYAAYTIRKCPTHDLKKEGKGTWATVETIEERWPQEDVIKQIEKLNNSPRSVTDKKEALMPNQKAHVTTLIENLTSRELDSAFEWSLIHLDSVTKPVSVLKRGRSCETYETVSIIAFVKRAPHKDLNPAILFQNIEKIKADRMRTLQRTQPQPNGFESIYIVGDIGMNKAKGGLKSREQKYSEFDESSTGDSMGTLVPSKSKSRSRMRHSHRKGSSHGGKADAEAGRFSTTDRVMPRPIPIERAVRERAYGPSYGASEPRFREDQYIDDLRRDEMLRRRERQVEDYIIDGRLDGRPEGRWPSDFVGRRESFDLRTIGWTKQHPFAPLPPLRRYPREDSSCSGW
ncbi:hypothetical protein V8E51_018422 [Hyaloscypha variabilis]